MEQTRYYWIDTCKTIGLLLVILGHGRLFPDTYQQFIYSFHMPLFFVLSGLLYKYKNFKGGLLHDINRLIVPYFIISLLCYIIQSGLALFQGDLSWSNCYHRFLGIFCVACHTGEFPPASGPTWFIIALFFVRILLSLRDSKWYRLGLTVISILAFILIKRCGWDPWIPIDTALMAIPFMTVGIALKPFRDYEFKKQNSLLLLFLSAFMIALLFITNRYNGLVDMSWCSYGRRLEVFYFNGLLGTIALLIISRLIPVKGASCEFCLTLSKGSLLVIGFNLMFVMVFQTVVERIIPSHTLTPLIGFVIGVVILYCFYWATKICQRFFPIILGTK